MLGMFITYCWEWTALLKKNYQPYPRLIKTLRIWLVRSHSQELPVEVASHLLVLEWQSWAFQMVSKRICFSNVVRRIFNWLQWKHGMWSKVKESAFWEFEWKLVTNKWKVLLFIHAGKQPVCSGNTSAQVCSLSIWIYAMLKWEPGQSRRCPCHKKQA